jgi:hypothetical protein
MSMAQIHSIHWNTLEDAYGKANNISHLLTDALADKASTGGEQSGPWFELWSRLYHQGTIYTASYAVVPIIVDAIKKADTPVTMNFFLLPVSIELARHSTGAPALPSFMADDYHASIKELGALANDYINVDDQYLRRAAEAAKLISLGEIDKANELIEGDDV